MPHASEPELPPVPTDDMFYETQVYSYGAAEILLSGGADMNAEQTKQFLSSLDSERFNAFVNATEATGTEKEVQCFTSNDVQSLKPNPNQALYIPASIEGDIPFHSPSTAWLMG
jgi:hypothetical protein